MAFLGNIIWFIFFGWWNFLLYGFLGLVCCITIIGIPIGKALFQYAKLMALPFGKVIIKETELKGKENVSGIRRVGGTIANILWLPVGIITFILNIGTMIVCAITIIGIPVAIVIARSCKFLLWPVGARVITKEEDETLRMERSMMKVMGTAMVVNNAMMSNQTGQSQAKSPEQVFQTQTQTIQSSQTLDNIKSGGTQALENIKETGGKAVAVIAETGSAGAEALKNRQRMIEERIRAQKRDITVDELLTQIEVKIYQNKVMAWIMPFLEYITLVVGVLCVIIGMFTVRTIFRAAWGIDMTVPMPNFGGKVMRGFFYGIVLSAPLMLMAAALGMIKKNHLFVLVVLGAQFLSHLTLGILGMGFSSLWILCYIGVITGYVFVFLVKRNAGHQQVSYSSGTQTMSVGAISQDEADEAAGRKFCSQCGAEVSGGISFCPLCGAEVK